MGIARTTFALAALLAGANALAHPGHAAPSIHVHDIDGVVLALVATLLVAGIAFGVRAIATRKKRNRP